MNAETDLAALIRNLEPRTLPATYVFCSVEDADYGALSHTSPIASFAEPEGLTLVLTRESADEESLAYEGTFRCISLQVQSSLEAVGLTAAVTGELAAHDISANVIAGYHHDHIFVPSRHGDLALNLMKAMSSRR